MDQADKDMHASLDVCILEMTYDLWRAGSVTENRYREVLAGIVERRRQRLDPPEVRRTPIPFPPEFVAECAVSDSSCRERSRRKELDALIASMHEWPEG